MILKLTIGEYGSISYYALKTLMPRRFLDHSSTPTSNSRFRNGSCLMTANTNIRGP